MWAGIILPAMTVLDCGLAEALLERRAQRARPFVFQPCSAAAWPLVVDELVRLAEATTERSSVGRKATGGHQQVCADILQI